MDIGLKLLVFLLCSAASSASAATPELVLAGGSLNLCSSLSLARCSSETALPDGRLATHYGLDASRRALAEDPLLWGDRAVLLPSLRDALAAATTQLGDGPFDERALVDALRTACSECAEPLWERLLDAERATLLAALELPQLESGTRRREHVSLAASRERGGVEVLQAFVAAAARRSDGRPRVALVTASALDSFDPVDYYLDALQQAGADPFWWPVDAATASIVFGFGDCAALDEARRRELGMAGRAEVYPDHATTQHAWCSGPDAAQLPAGTHGVFFTGGDQWRLRRAFFDAADRPNAWLQALRDAFDAGRLAIGGTSAGTAVQSGAHMLSNGTARHALQHGTANAPPPLPGCRRAGLCAGIDEDAMTLWPAGGLGLAAPFLLDTHFSERAREWRLLRALGDLPAQRWAIGVDETSAIRIERVASGGFVVEAIGARGAWLFDAGSRRCGRIEATAAYIAPDLNWQVSEDGARLLDATRHASPAPGVVRDIQQGAMDEDPLGHGAVRAAAWRLARSNAASEAMLETSGARLWLQRGQDAPTWTAANGSVGIGTLRVVLEYADDRCRR
jgi:cyanophycinase-like exopeptidase